MRAVFKSRKFKVGAIIAIALVVLGSGAYYMSVIRRVLDDATDQSDSSTSERTTEQIIEQANKVFVLERDRISKLANKVAVPEDLVSIEEVDRGKVGLAIVDASIENNLQKANIFIDYLMAQNDSSALDAAVKGYQIADTSARKEQCLGRMNELARNLGIIGQNETLPNSYYSSASGEQN